MLFHGLQPWLRSCAASRLKTQAIRMSDVPCEMKWTPALRRSPPAPQCQIPVEHVSISESVGKFFNARIEIGVVEFGMSVAKHAFNILPVTRAGRDDFMQDEILGRAYPHAGVLQLDDLRSSNGSFFIG